MQPTATQMEGTASTSAAMATARHSASSSRTGSTASHSQLAVGNDMEAELWRSKQEASKGSVVNELSLILLALRTLFYVYVLFDGGHAVRLHAMRQVSSAT